MLLSVFVGTGSQLLCMVFTTLGKPLYWLIYSFIITSHSLCMFGVSLSTKQRSSHDFSAGQCFPSPSCLLFISLLQIFSVFAGAVAGYVSARLYKCKILIASSVAAWYPPPPPLVLAVGGLRWKSNILLSALLVPGWVWAVVVAVMTCASLLELCLECSLWWTCSCGELALVPLCHSWHYWLSSVYGLVSHFLSLSLGPSLVSENQSVLYQHDGTWHLAISSVVFVYRLLSILYGPIRFLVKYLNKTGYPTLFPVL